MAKNAEDRYQSALGLKHDLQHCFDQWQASGQIEPFELGSEDRCDRFLIAEKLYGREAQVQRLLNAFEQVSQGQSALMLVSGYSGVGKTAVVNEVHRPITRQKGHFIKGKFDQFNRSIPFSAFVQAFGSLMGQLLGESDGALSQWKAKILDVVGESGQVLIEVIPEIESIIGQQPAVPELSGTAAQNRFNRLFTKFIQAFTTSAHPLVIFLDDLQWADSASLNLLQVLIDDIETGYLLILGAYRDNEVFSAHPLTLTVAELKQRGAKLQTLVLKPLNCDHINLWMADTLQCDRQIATPFSELVYQKTKGNPFFTTQFLQGLYDDGYITFDVTAGYWLCDLTQIQQRGLSNDVMTFMTERLQKLPESTQDVLKLAACIGNQFDLATLAIVCNQSQEQVAQNLWETLQLGLVLPESQTYKFFLSKDHPNKPVKTSDPTIGSGYRFLHDQVQQAAYGLIADHEKPTYHLQIGRRLLAQCLAKNKERNIFDIVNHLNKGIDLINDGDERQQLATLNLEAGQGAKKSIAYAEAVSYFEQGIQILSNQGWKTYYLLMLELYSELVNVQFLRGEFKAVQAIGEYVLAHIHDTVDALPIYITQISSDLAQGKMLAGFELGRQVLGSLDIHIPTAINEHSVQQKMNHTLTQFKRKTIPELIALPQNHAPQFLKLQELLTVIIGYAYIVRPELLPIIICEQVSLLMQHGNIPASASIYALYGMLLIGTDPDSGFFAGDVALAVMDAFPSKQFEMRVRNLIYSYITPWKQLLRESLFPLKQGFTVGLEVGDIEYTSYGINHYTQFLYFSGTDLATVDHEMLTYCNILKKYGQEGILAGIRIFHQAVLNLMHGSHCPWQLEGKIFQESNHVMDWQENHLEYYLCVLYINKLVLSVLFNNPDLALNYAALANDADNSLTGEFHVSYLYCYRALAHLAVSPALTSDQQANRLDQVAIDLAKLERFASYAPMNFQHQVDLVLAERHRVLGQRLEAIDAYDRAIAGANANGYLQEESFANELAAKFCLDWGKDTFAATYMQAAYYCYSRWGANAKVADLRTRYPQLLQPIFYQEKQRSTLVKSLERVSSSAQISIHSSHGATGASDPLNDALDLAAILKAAQSLTATVQLDELLQTLSKIILQQSGGDLLMLALPNPGALTIESLATESTDWQVVQIATLDAIDICCEPLVNNPRVPCKLMQYVKRTRELLFTDTLDMKIPVVDDYLLNEQPQSFLCSPLMHRDELIGILYLHSSIPCDLIAPSRVSVLNFLLSQVAIALHNAQLYQDRQQAQEQLQQSLGQLQASNEELEAFSYSVAHDLRSPLRAINGYSQALQEDYGQLIDRAGHDYFHRIKANTIRMAELIDDLLRLAQISRTELQSAPINLGHLAQTILNDLNESAPKRRIETTIAPDMFIEADPTLMKVVMQNLLDNAWKFSRDRIPAHIEVGILPPEPPLEHTQGLTSPIYFVRDNGVGFDMTYAHKLFGIFQRLHHVEEFPGTGIGLVIVKRAVHRHGGQVWVEAAVDQGATVFFTIPSTSFQNSV